MAGNNAELMTPEQGRISPNVAYERSDVSARRIVLIAVGILAIGLLASVFVAFPFFALKSNRNFEIPKRSPQAATGWPEPPQPRLQASPELDLQGYTAGYNKTLGSYSWIDQSQGVAAIPLDRAMQIASERGIPRFPVNPSVVLSQPRQSTPVTGFQGKVVEPPE